MVIFALCLLVSVEASLVYFPKGWMLSWVISDDEINFTLQLTQETVDNYNWVGIGFKLADDPDNYMTGADIINIVFEKGPVDSYALYNGAPLSDIDAGGTNDIGQVSYDSKLTYSWTRDLNTGDANDLLFVQGMQLRVLWATGLVDYGVQQKHAFDDRGVIYIILEDDFVGDYRGPIDLS